MTTNQNQKKMKIRPLQDRILVKRLNEEEKTKGGIIIPDTAKEKPQEGRVVAIGKGKVLDDGKVVPLEIKVGEKILFSSIVVYWLRVVIPLAKTGRSKRVVWASSKKYETNIESASDRR